MQEFHNRGWCFYTLCLSMLEGWRPPFNVGSRIRRDRKDKTPMRRRPADTDASKKAQKAVEKDTEALRKYTDPKATAAVAAVAAAAASAASPIGFPAGVGAGANDAVRVLHCKYKGAQLRAPVGVSVPLTDSVIATEVQELLQDLGCSVDEVDEVEPPESMQFTVEEGHKPSQPSAPAADTDGVAPMTTVANATDVQAELGRAGWPGSQRLKLPADRRVPPAIRVGHPCPMRQSEDSPDSFWSQTGGSILFIGTILKSSFADGEHSVWVRYDDDGETLQHDGTWLGDPRSLFYVLQSSQVGPSPSESPFKRLLDAPGSRPATFLDHALLPASLGPGTVLFVQQADWQDLPGHAKGKTFWPCLVTQWDRLRDGQGALKGTCMHDNLLVYIMHLDLVPANYGKTWVVTHAVPHVPRAKGWAGRD